jgi:CMP-N-acetylneuraminic acid synthetase
VITIIPARGGSRRIPKKNIKLFHGKPIIAYSIELAKQVSEQVIVDTDDPVIASIAEDYGADTRIRPRELARDEIGTQEVVGAALRDLAVDCNTDVMVLYATSPLLTEKNLRDGYWVLQNVETGCVYSMDEDGNPSGGFYIGYGHIFADAADPYEHGVGMITNDIDINTPEDWERAEKLYEERYG